MPRRDAEARREYNREYQRKWYRQNRELHLERVLRVTRRARVAAKHFVDACKRQPCVDRGGIYPPCVMDFDHVRGKKVANLSRMRGVDPRGQRSSPRSPNATLSARTATADAPT
jgi:hypothetical protein